MPSLVPFDHRYDLCQHLYFVFAVGLEEMYLLGLGRVNDRVCVYGGLVIPRLSNLFRKQVDPVLEDRCVVPVSQAGCVVLTERTPPSPGFSPLHLLVLGTVRTVWRGNSPIGILPYIPSGPFTG